MWKAAKNTLLLPVTLCLVSVVMSFLIVGVYTITKDRIEAQAIAAREAARRSALPQAVTMTEIPLAEGDPVDYCFQGFDAAGQSVGFVSQVTAIGFGGPIEVTVGMDMSGSIVAVQVGGGDFAETAGLGSKTKDEEFTGQFAGKSGLLVLKKDIDSVTGASVSSGAVVSGVNQALVYMTAQLPPPPAGTPVEELPLTEEEIALLLPGAQNLRFMGGGANIDGWWQADNGRIVQATGFGSGPIVVKIGMDAEGYCVGILIGDENFMESQGYGAKIQEPAFWQNFLGKKGPQVYGQNGVDAISGATSSSNAALKAINACLSFDPTALPAEIPAASEEVVPVATEAPATPAPATTEPSAEASAEVLPTPVPAPDAETAASVVAMPTPVPAPDAVTAASGVVEILPTPSPVPTPDAATAATAAETPAPTPEPTPDAATAASAVATPTPAPTPDAESGATLGG